MQAGDGAASGSRRSSAAASKPASVRTHTRGSGSGSTLTGPLAANISGTTPNAIPAAAPGATGHNFSNIMPPKSAVNTHARAHATAPTRSLPASDVTVLVHDAASFGVAERGIWHYGNLGAPLPRRIWREKDGISIVAARAHVRVEDVKAYLQGSGGGTLTSGGGTARASGDGTTTGAPTGGAVSTAAAAAKGLPHGAPAAASIATSASDAGAALEDPSPAHAPSRTRSRGRMGDAIAALPTSTSDARDGSGALAAHETITLSTDALPSGVTMVMAPTTATQYFYAAYRIVIAVDISPSMFTLDVHAARVPFADALSTLGTYLRGLVAPAWSPAVDADSEDVLASMDEATASRTGSNLPHSVHYTPEILITIIAQPAHVPGTPRLLPRVLVHGYALTHRTVEPLLAALATSFKSVEHEMVAQIRRTEPHARQRSAVSDAPQRRLPLEPAAAVGGAAAPVSPGPVIDHSGPAHAAAGASLTELIESAVFMLKLLPSYACPSITLISDCVAALPNSTTYGSIIMQMLRHDMACNIIQVGTCSGVHAAFGRVPDTEAMQFLAMSTGGFRIRQRDLAAACEVGAGAVLPSRTSDVLQPPATISSTASATSSSATTPVISADSVAQPARPRSRVTSRLAPRFTTAGWSSLQIQSFARTSVLTVAPPTGDDSISASMQGLGARPDDAARDRPGKARGLSQPPIRGRFGRDPQAYADVSTASGADRGARDDTSRPAAPLPHKTNYRMIVEYMLASAADATVGRGTKQSEWMEMSRQVLAAPSGGGIAAATPTPRARSAAAVATGVKSMLPRSAINKLLEDGTAAARVSHADFAFPWFGPPPSSPFQRHRLVKYKLHIDSRLLLECRLKEGFRIVMGVSGNADIFGGAMPEVALPADAAGNRVTQLVLAWQLQVIVLYTMVRSDKDARKPGADDRSQTTDPRRSFRRDVTGGLRYVRADTASVGTGGASTAISVDAKGRPQHGRAQPPTEAPKQLVTKSRVCVYIDVFARRDFIALLQATLDKDSDLSMQLVGRVGTKPAAPAKPVAAAGPVAPPPRRPVAAQATTTTAFVAPFRVTVQQGPVPAGASATAALSEPSGRAAAAPTAISNDPASGPADGLRIFERLTATATEPRRVAALVGFVAVLQQVDRSLVHLCNVPQPGTILAALHGPSAPVLGWQVQAEGVLPLPSMNFPTVPLGSATTAGPATAIVPPSATWASNASRTGLRDGDAGYVASPLTIDAGLARTASGRHAAKVSAFDVSSIDGGRDGQSTSLAARRASQRGQAGGANPAVTLHQQCAPYPSFDLRLLITPFAALSVSAWHRWFDVERFEVTMHLPMLAAIDQQTALPCVRSTGGGSPCLRSWLYRHVLEALSRWADVELPFAEDTYSYRAGTGDSSTGQPAHIEMQRRVLSAPASADARCCSAAGVRAGHDAAASRPFLRVLGDPSLPFADTPAATRPATAAAKFGSAASISTEQQSISKARSFHSRLASAPATDPLHSERERPDVPAHPASAKPAIGAQPTARQPSRARSLSFVLARAEVLAGAHLHGINGGSPHGRYAQANIATLEGAGLRMQGRTLASALVAVHVAYFNCPPPVRTAQLQELKAAIEAELQVPIVPQPAVPPPPAPVSQSTAAGGGTSPSNAATMIGPSAEVGKVLAGSPSDSSRPHIAEQASHPSGRALTQEHLADLDISAAASGGTFSDDGASASSELQDSHPNEAAASATAEQNLDTTRQSAVPQSDSIVATTLEELLGVGQPAPPSSGLHTSSTPADESSTADAGRAPDAPLPSRQSEPPADALASPVFPSEAATIADGAAGATPPAREPETLSSIPDAVHAHAVPTLPPTDTAKVRVAPCPLARILTGRAHVHDADHAADALSPATKGAGMFAEMPAEDEQLSEAMCCGGTPIPPDVLQSILWHRSWGYHIVCPAEAVTHAGAASELIAEIASTMMSLTRSRLSSSLASSAPAAVDLANWQLMTWDLLHAAPHGEEDAGPVSKPISIMNKAQFSLVFPVATPRADVPGALFSSTLAGVPVDVVGQPHRRQIAVLQQVVRLHFHTLPSGGIEAHISVGMWMEPQFGYVRLACVAGSNELASNVVASQHPAPLQFVRTATARDVYAALVNSIYAQDTSILQRSLASQPMLKSCSVRVHACDSMQHTRYAAPQLALPLASAEPRAPPTSQRTIEDELSTSTLPVLVLPDVKLGPAFTIRLVPAGGGTAPTCGGEHALLGSHASGSLIFATGAFGDPAAAQQGHAPQRPSMHGHTARGLPSQSPLVPVPPLTFLRTSSASPFGSPFARSQDASVSARSGASAHVPTPGAASQRGDASILRSDSAGSGRPLSAQELPGSAPAALAGDDTDSQRGRRLSSSSRTSAGSALARFLLTGQKDDTSVR